jgi:hypothetical protein
MPSAPAKFFGVAVVVATVAAVGYQLTRQAPAGPPVNVTPPPNAQYVEEGPSGVIGAVLTGRPGEREQARNYYYGRWVPAPGWQGVVANVDRESARTVVRLHYQAASALQEYWVIANVPGAADVNPGDTVLVQGQIAEVDGKVIVGNVVTRLVLDPATVAKK